MLRSLWLCMIYGMFLFGGLVAPFALGLGYVWVDTFTPQRVAYSILTDVPVSMIMAVAAIGAYLLMDRKSPPRPNFIIVLIVLMAIWVTVTTAAFAVAPEAAWPKWGWAVRTIGFAAFMPFLFRSRVQIESMIQVYIFSAAAQILPYGAKTILSGGSYHASLGLLSGNSGLAEGATLAAVAMMTVPLVLWLRRHTLLLPKVWPVRLIYTGLAVAAVSASIGTFERTGLIAILVCAIALWLQSRHKVRYAAVAAVVGFVFALWIVRPDSEWVERMSTIGQYNQDSSSLGRLLVWKWTLQFVQSHPWGGGFNAYVVDVVTFPGDASTPPLVVHGKAFHSMYFEMLGENGWPGLALFAGLLGGSFAALLQVARKCANLQDLQWCRDLAIATLVSETILLACGSFVGIAYQPEVYYVFAIAATLLNHVRVVERHAVASARMFEQPALMTNDMMHLPRPSWSLTGSAVP